LIQLSGSFSLVQASWITSSSASTNWRPPFFSNSDAIESNVNQDVPSTSTALGIFSSVVFIVLGPTHGHRSFESPFYVIQSLVEFTRVLNASMSLNLD
jgi:hypothetical protein